MSDKTDTPATDESTASAPAKAEKQVKANKTAKPEMPANVVVTELAHGSVLFNALPTE